MPANISADGKISEIGIARIASHNVYRLKQHILNLGDLVVSRRGDVTRSAYVDLHQDGWICGTGCLKIILGNEEMANSRFISYWFRLPEIKEWLVRHSVGATMLNINASIMSEVPIKLPALSVQKTLTEFFIYIDDRINLLYAANNATLEVIAQTLFKSWFIDFDPVHAKQHGRMPEGMNEETAALFPDRFENNSIGYASVPMGWVIRPLSEAYEVNPSRPLRKGVVAPYVDMANIGTQGHVIAEMIQRQMVSGSKFTNDDTLLARITPCLENGKTAFVDCLQDGETGWGSTEFIVLRPKSPLPPYHAYLLCRYKGFREYAIQSMSGTSGRQRVQKALVHE